MSTTTEITTTTTTTTTTAALTTTAAAATLGTKRKYDQVSADDEAAPAEADEALVEDVAIADEEEHEEPSELPPSDLEGTALPPATATAAATAAPDLLQPLPVVTATTNTAADSQQDVLLGSPPPPSLHQTPPPLAGQPLSTPPPSNSTTTAVQPLPSLLRWYPTSIFLETRTVDGTAVHADLMQLIGQGTKGNKCTLSERYYLPPQYNQNTPPYRAKTIAPLFANACAAAGCEVRLKGWEKSKGFLKFVCPHYRRYKSASSKRAAAAGAATPPTATAVAAAATPVEEDLGLLGGDPGRKEPPSTPTTKTLESEKSHTCPFSFIVFWEESSSETTTTTTPAATASDDEKRGRWYVCATGAGTPYHEGHGRKEFSEVELRRKQLQVEGAFDILLPPYKRIVRLIGHQEDRMNTALQRLEGLIQELEEDENNNNNNNHHLKDAAVLKMANSGQMIRMAATTVSPMKVMKSFTGEDLVSI